MKISKLVAIDDNGNEQTFLIKEGTGIFITDDDQQLTLNSNNEILNMMMIRTILK